ncbi:sensor histidine kinase, partial [Haloferula sp.]|uniref:sensor histidine kinase n=1 Tax=Haloferula sp. TaxID=2497595 RepID=UPI003C759A0F
PEQKPTTRVVIRDVTSEHQTEQVRKDFVANASHELRTPLAIINGYLENLLDDGLLEDPDLTRRFLKIMRKHTERIARIVEDMLVISRLESGEAAALKIKPFRLRSCIQDVLERLELVIQGQQANIKIEMPDEDLTILGDRFYWTQVLFNLVENALKQNPRKGLSVSIGCERVDGVTRIWVADDGVGIPSADLTHIFRRFYRVEKHHSQEEIKGTGLGLSIVKRAIEAHGGSINVTSTPGVDTRFTIEIPFEAEVRLSESKPDDALSA